MLEKIIPDFSIEQIANSGQCFRLNRTDEKDTWKLVAFGKILKIYQSPGSDNVSFDCTSSEFSNIWENYFDLKRDYGNIKNSILALNDPYLTNAVRFGSGLRILRQDLWEMIISSIISQQNNIAKIKLTIERLCKSYGLQFPSPKILANLSEDDYKSFGLGYRTRYILHIARMVDDGHLDLVWLKTLPCEDAIKYLKTFYGIGDKVANCIALFGLHKIDAFPVDVWIKRIINQHYQGNFNTAPFQDYAGIVQQYMFFYERSMKRRIFS